MTGVGEGVRALGDPEPFGLLIVPSAHALSTPAVYAEFDRLGLGRDPDELDRLSGQVPGAARDGSLLAERLLHNDLEAPARSLCPPIGDALADVRAAGAVRAMVSGSGPDRVRHLRRRRRRRARAGRRRGAAVAPSARRRGDAGRARVRRAGGGLSVHPAGSPARSSLALYLVIRRREHGRGFLALGALVAVGAGLIGFGVVELPNVEQLIEDAGQALGKWTYLVVGVLAFLETGAFIGLVAPGETTVIVGGLVAGQGEISLLLLIAIVWTCAVLGDLTSYTLGRRLGRDFMVRHGARVKITEERLEQVEAFFERRGGMTILIGRFIGLVRAIAPFIAGASRMPLRKFLPYDVLGAGLWATTFCVLGYVFWRSFDQLTAWVSRGLFAFGLVVALIVGIVFVVRLQRSPELRRADGGVDRRAAREAAAAAGRAVPARGLARASCGRWRGARRRPARFVWNRFTPGDLGLEVTTLLALAAVGAFTFVLLGDAPEAHAQARLDELAFDVADRLYSEPLKDVAVWVTALGSLAGGRARSCCVDRALGGRARRRFVDARRARRRVPAHVAGRRRRQGGLRPPAPARRARRRREGASYPSGHAAYAVAWVACARRARARRVAASPTRFAAVTAAVVLVVAIALEPRLPARALPRPTSTAGSALGATIFALARRRRGRRRPPASE